MAKAIGPMHLSRSYAYEVQRTNNFEVVIAGIAGSDNITLAVDSFPLPSSSNPAIELSHGNAKVKVAGQAEFDDGELVVKDLITVDIEMLIQAWRDQVYNPRTDQIGWAADYKRDVTVYQFGPDGTFIRKWKIIGAWPSSVSFGDLSYDGSDMKTISMTLTYDKAYRE